MQKQKQKSPQNFVVHHPAFFELYNRKNYSIDTFLYFLVSWKLVQKTYNGYSMNEYTKERLYVRRRTLEQKLKHGSLPNQHRA